MELWERMENCGTERLEDREVDVWFENGYSDEREGSWGMKAK